MAFGLLNELSNDQKGEFYVKYRYIVLLFLALAFTIPASIKTEYKDYSGDRVDLALQVKPYSDSALLLTWQPEGQQDVLGYEIERHNAEGQFVSAGFVPALRGSKTRNFQFVYYPESSGKQVYRLKKIKTDRSEILSREIIYRFQAESGIRNMQAVLKNGSVEIQFQNEVSQDINLTVLNASGQKISSSLPRWFEDGEQNLTWNYAQSDQKLASGTYVLELHTGTGICKTELKIK